MNIRIMQPDEISRIGEIDRSETFEGIFKIKPVSSRGLILEYEPYEKPINSRGWSEAGVNERTESWRPYLDDGGTMFGAFDGDKLTGFSIISKSIDEYTTELVAHFIHVDYRRTGLGAQLLERSEKKAVKDGSKVMSVASNPTPSAFMFYSKHGYLPASITASGTDQSIINHFSLPELLLTKLLS